MDFAFKFVMRLFITMIVSLILTPIIKLISFKIGAVDRPEIAESTPRQCRPQGTSIFFSFSFALLWEFRAMIPFDYVWPMLLGAAIVVVTGLLDDIFELTPCKNAGFDVSGFGDLFCCWYQNQHGFDPLSRGF